MITQEIKLYDEPQPTYNYTPPASYKQTNMYGTAWDDIPTEAEFQKHLEMARSKYKVGQRYKYKTNAAAMIEIIGFETDRVQSAIYGESPGVIKGRRVALAGEYAPTYNYSIGEIDEMLEIA